MKNREQSGRQVSSMLSQVYEGRGKVLAAGAVEMSRIDRVTVGHIWRYRQ